MKLTVKEERKVESLKDLRIIKAQLTKKSQKKLVDIGNRVDYITLNTSVQNIYEEVLEKFNLQHSLMNMLPMFLKYKDVILNSKLVNNVKTGVKKPKFIFWTSLVGIMGTLVFFKTKKYRKSTQS